MNDEPRLIPPVNRNAIISVIAGLLTLVSFCTAVAPIPLTGYVCYPAAVILGLVAVLTGIAALTQIRTTNDDGRTYALIGIWIGAIAVVASLCAISLGILLLPRFVALVQQYIRLH